MPLSDEQLACLKDPGTGIFLQIGNPKKPGSKAYERYDKYKAAKTIGEAQSLGANWQDLTGDFEKAYLTLCKTNDDASMSANTRGAQQGTPDREASDRAKMPATASTGANPSRAMIPVSEPRKLDLDKVEISSATMQAFRMMMREEISYVL